MARFHALYNYCSYKYTSPEDITLDTPIGENDSDRFLVSDLLLEQIQLCDRYVNLLQIGYGLCNDSEGTTSKSINGIKYYFFFLKK